MKFMKRGLAVFLTVLLMMPTQPLVVANALPLETGLEQTGGEKTDEEIVESKEAGKAETNSAGTEDSKGTEVSEESSDEEGTSAPAESSKEEETSASEENSEEEESSAMAGDSEEAESSVAEESSEEEETLAPEESSKTEESLDPEESSETEESTAAEETTKAEDTGIKENLGNAEETIVKNPESAKPLKTPAKEKNETKSTPANAVKAKDQVQFNTGSYVVTVVSQEDWENELGDAWFEEDGSYTIEIPETNPFFPYEVQFTYKNKTASRWFMTPDDNVEVGDHTFYVHAFFDGTAVTQLSLEVAGDTVVVYPKEKQFTNDGGIQPLSLLPLEEKKLDTTVDLSGYTPAELARVSVSSIFAGNVQLGSTDQVIWTPLWEDDYTISSQGEFIDLSQDTTGRTTTRWQMIVGDSNQLAGNNIRYLVDVEVTMSKDWLLPTVYIQDSEGQRKNVPTIKSDNYMIGYYDYEPEEREFYARVSRKDVDGEAEGYINLKMNPSVFKNHRFSDLKAYEGNYTDPEKAKAGGRDITAQLFADDMTQKDSGYKIDFNGEERWVTLVTCDSAGNATGCLPFTISVDTMGNSIITYGDCGLFEITDRGKNLVSGSTNSSSSNGLRNLTYKMSYGYAADKEYNLILGYSRSGVESSESVTAAYAGQFASVDAAKKAGAADIKGSLFDHGDQGGYKANYSKGIFFTIFIGEDGSQDQEVYRYCVKAKDFEPTLSSNALVHFNGLRDAEGNYVSCYEVDEEEDSYADYSYLTILVEEDTDLTKLAPEFYCQRGINLYASGSSSPEISGKSVHDFSKGPVQYTASAENKENGKNYWLQIVKPEQGAGKIYINSLADEDAKTRKEGETIFSTREMILDGRSDYRHDILLVNIGTEAISGLSAELISDQVELDDYWDLTGDYELAGFTSVRGTTTYGGLWNLAKLRIRAKEGAESGSDISGTLTVKSGNTALMVLNLTGTIGDPSITTKEIPNAVKYVPYGTMIQNSNKYSWNTVTYSLAGGKLPGGMIIKPNGELYGVPTETGTFTFTVRMRNSYSSFKSSECTFTFTVLENTDANVDGATDTGYELTNRVQDVTSASYGDQLMVSQGVYGEFVDLFLDGEKLTRGVDYTAESGSTRITIRSQTLKDSRTPGTHTLGIEFRKKDDQTLQRAAQNYRIGSSTNTGGGDSDNDNYTRSKAASASQTSKVKRDAKKGYVNSDTGIITGEGAGYSHWEKDDTGWKLIYADGTAAAGTMVQQENKEDVEQVLWEKVNNAWYAFGAGGYLKSGWIYDYRLRSWYLISENHGMKSGWYTDAQDRQTYYLEPVAGNLAVGWKQFDSKWYYFNSVSLAPTWELDRETGNWFYNARSGGKPYGALYRSGKTPDGYYVDQEGVWDGNEKQ